MFSDVFAAVFRNATGLTVPIVFIHDTIMCKSDFCRGLSVLRQIYNYSILADIDFNDDRR